MAEEKSQILVIGGTGFVGKQVVAAATRAGHPTYAVVRDPAPSDPVKVQLLQQFQSSGVTLLKGDLHDHESLVEACKKADVVISTVGGMQIMDQTKILDAIKEAGNIKRFFPSEFVSDVDHLHKVEPATSVLATKIHIRRAVEASGIPYTFVVSNGLAGYLVPSLGQIGDTGTPTESENLRRWKCQSNYGQ